MRSNTASTRWRCTSTRSRKGERVILVDDLIATGGTAEGAVKLLRQIGAEVLAACFIIDLPELGGADKLRKTGRAGAHAGGVRGPLSTAVSGLRIALYQPDIAQNTGTILRLCACLGRGRAHHRAMRVPGDASAHSAAPAWTISITSSSARHNRGMHSTAGGANAG